MIINKSNACLKEKYAINTLKKLYLNIKKDSLYRIRLILSSGYKVNIVFIGIIYIVKNINKRN